jgi:hypothetical protein
MITEKISLATCDFCKGPYPAVVKFARVYDQWGVSHWLEPIHPLSGSDHLAIWCESCGPKHRSDRRYREWMILAMERAVV